jgi:hypothetical protein
MEAAGSEKFAGYVKKLVPTTRSREAHGELRLTEGHGMPDLGNLRRS